jgi:zinc D-Ala-D-Ala carboxypeptidase
MTLRYFKPTDFACKHCGENKTSPLTMELADELRHRCGFPLTISSGYRCPDHNAKVSGTGRTGPHTTGEAFDVAVSHGQAFEVLRHAMKMNFSGIGVQQKGGGRFIHLDTLPNAPGQPRPTVWSYG